MSCLKGVHRLFLQWLFFRADFYPSLIRYQWYLTNILTLNKLQYDSDCTFKEGIFANYWTTYSSLTWGLDRMQLSTWYMAINGRGHRVSAKNSKKSRPSAHFLPDPIEGKFITKGRGKIPSRAGWFICILGFFINLWYDFIKISCQVISTTWMNMESFVSTRSKDWSCCTNFTSWRMFWRRIKNSFLFIFNPMNSVHFAIQLLVDYKWLKLVSCWAVY